MKGRTLQICLDKQGTHTIQAIIEIALTQEEEDFIAEELQGHFAELANVPGQSKT